MNAVSAERSRWRDIELSERHRKWGYDSPMVDLDWMVIEYDHARAVALISWKHELAKEETKCNFLAFSRLADDAHLPAFQVVYSATTPAWFKREPMNQRARDLLRPSETGRQLNEVDFVTWIYQLRGRDIPDEVLAFLLANPWQRLKPADFSWADEVEKVGQP
jgi:hypothetical protein